jgi:hypothetical protein
VQYKYFYRLGHQPIVGLVEVDQLKAKIDYVHDKWLFSETKIDIEKTGSLVFGGTMEMQWEEGYRLSEEEFYKVLEEKINAYTKNNPTKMAGIVIPFKWQKQTLKIAKGAGIKKVNIQLMPTIPSYGHWKNAKVWWMLVQEKGTVWLGRIEEMANQEFWSNLDMNLPKGDMARGIINMKFARTLLNFTEKKTIWDPFAGHGRVILAGLDIKEKFYASDINPQKLNDEIMENYEFAVKAFNQEFLRKHRLTLPVVNGQTSAEENPPTLPPLAKLAQSFQLDASYLTSATLESSPVYNQEISKENFSEVSIVTEGYLGFNFKGKPLPIQMKTEWEGIKKIWEKMLASSGELGIAEVIGCVPFYQIDGKRLLPPFLQELEGIGGYQLENLDNEKKFLEYARPQAFVGHLVLKFVKVAK